MNILAVCQYYAPEPVRFPDFCAELVRRGHSVTVLTGVPNYPMGKTYPGYEHRQNRTQTVDGVRVLRCATIPRGSGAAGRFLNYFSFPLSAWLRAGLLGGDFELVLVNQQSPVMMAWPAMRYARMHRRPVVMYCMDLWPDSLRAGGLSERSPVYRLFARLSRQVYRRMDRILVTSRCFTDFLTERFSVPASRIFYLPQYAEALFEETAPPAERAQTLNLTFAGNIGTAQSLETVLKAARLAKDPRLRWHIVGDGSELARLKALAADLPQVIFHGRRPLEEMPAIYAAADAMLVTLMKDPVLSLTLPGKVQTIMAAGKPILCAADGEAARTVREAGCGFCVPAEDAQALAKAADDFAACPERARLGENAKAWYAAHFTRAEFMNRLEQALLETQKGSSI